VYARLGDDDTVDVLARIGTVLHPAGDLDTGPLTQTQELIHDLQTDMANGLGAAMQGIQLDGDGKLHDTGPGTPIVGRRPDLSGVRQPVG
jgi:hypothetical protein